MEISEERREALISRLSETGGRLRVRNALNPILWLCGLVAIPCIGALTWSDVPHPAIPVVLYTVIATAVFAFLFLLLFDRDRLQSEEYLLKSKTIDLIEEKGSRKAIDAATVQAISQPEFLALPDSEEGATE